MNESARLIFPRLNPNDYTENADYRNKIKNYVRAGVGGFCVFQGKKEEVKTIIEELRRIAKRPLLFSADYENGLRMRLDDAVEYPRNWALAKMNDQSAITKVAELIALEASTIGIDWNLAPVADVNNNPKNPIINIRAFSDNPEETAKCVDTFIQGAKLGGGLSCAKHFPGHGDVAIDSHLDLPILDYSLERLDSLEFIPFKQAISSGVDSIMLAHIATPKICGDNVPASLSRTIATDVLRVKLGFDGVIITDALEMKAIANNYDSYTAVKLALSAGVDIALMPENVDDALKAALDYANEAPEQAKKSLERIDKLIEKRNSIKIDKTFQQEELAGFALSAAYKAIKLSGDDKLLPLKNIQYFTALAYIDGEDIERGSEFFRLLAQSVEISSDFGFIDSSITDEQIDLLKKNLEYTELFVFAFFDRPRAYKGSLDNTEKAQEIINKIAGGKPTISVILGNPYLSEQIKTDAQVIAYSDSISSIAATILYLSGMNFRDYFAE